MNASKATFEATRTQFIENLERSGFRFESGEVTGAVETSRGPMYVGIAIPGGFPFDPPIVTPADTAIGTWHRETSGAMCLYGDTESSGFPWLDTSDLLESISGWFDNTFAGWPDDHPSLDLQRYFPSATCSQILVYDDVSTFENEYVTLRVTETTITITGSVGNLPKKPPRTTKKGRTRNIGYGFVAAIGEPSEPPTTWDEIAQQATTALPSDLAMKARAGVLDMLIVRYERDGVSAVVALQVQDGAAGGPALRALRTAPSSYAARRARVGADFAVLQTKRVAVVGAGAIGSFLCSLLARNGVGHIQVHDSDYIRPGNLIRHLANDDHIGAAKTDAVKQLIERDASTATTVETAPQVVTMEEAEALFQQFDLVIDATASTRAGNLLGYTAKATGSNMVSVCLQESGNVVRVDIVPPLSGDPIARTVTTPGGDEVFESGCGEPLTITAPSSILEAAALATRHSAGILLGRPVNQAGEIRDYR